MVPILKERAHIWKPLSRKFQFGVYLFKGIFKLLCLRRWVWMCVLSIQWNFRKVEGSWKNFQGPDCDSAKRCPSHSKSWRKLESSTVALYTHPVYLIKQVWQDFVLKTCQTCLRDLSWPLHEAKEPILLGQCTGPVFPLSCPTQLPCWCYEHEFMSSWCYELQ